MEDFTVDQAMALYKLEELRQLIEEGEKSKENSGIIIFGSVSIKQGDMYTSEMLISGDFNSLCDVLDNACSENSIISKIISAVAIKRALEDMMKGLPE